MKTKPHKYFVFFLFFALNFQLIGQNVDSLKKLLATAPKEEKWTLLTQTAGIYLQNFELDSALLYFSNSLDFVKTPNEFSIVYQNLGMIYFYQDNFSLALDNFKKSLSYAQIIENDSIIARRYSDIGVVYDYLSAFDKAIEYYFKSLELLEKLKDKPASAKIYNNLGIINQNRGQVSLALEYYDKSLKIKQEFGAKNTEIASTYVNIGSAYEQLKKYDKALENYFSALEIFQSEKFDKYTALVLNNIAGIYFFKNDIENTQIYLKKAVTINLELDNISGLSSNYFLNGKIFETQNNLDSAVFYMQKALTLAQKIGSLAEISRILTHLIIVFETKQDYEKAYNLQVELITIKDSINNKDLNDKIETLQIVYDTEKKEQRIDNLQKDIKKNKIIWLAIAFILSLLILLIIVVYRQKLTKSQYDVKLFNQRLLRLQMNPHFIFNALTSIQSFMLEKNTKQASIYLSSFSKLTRSILNNSRAEFISLEEEIETTENYLKIQKLRFDNKFDYEIIVDENLDTEYYLIPPMISQPFVENSIIHGFKEIEYKGKIIIEYKINKNNLEISIIDNGKGVDKNKNKTHKSHALDITKERLKILNKKKNKTISFIFENLNDISEKTGTKTVFSIPLITKKEEDAQSNNN